MGGKLRIDGIQRIDRGQMLVGRRGMIDDKHRMDSRQRIGGMNMEDNRRRRRVDGRRG